MISAYGGTLVDPVFPAAQFAEAVGDCTGAPLTLSETDIIHLGNLAAGIYSPLSGFMTGREYRSTIDHHRLPEGPDWSIPITLPVPAPDGVSQTGATHALVNDQGAALAVLTVSDVFEVSPADDCVAVFGTDERAHPGVDRFLSQPRWRVGGSIMAGRDALPVQPFFHTVRGLREELARLSGEVTTAFSTRNISHLGHDSLSAGALRDSGSLGINIITGFHDPNGFHADFVFESYRHLIDARGLGGHVVLNNMRLPFLRAGPREAFLQAIMLQNLGFERFIVGRDHAGVGAYYDSFASQEYLAARQGLEIEIVNAPTQWYCRGCGGTTNSRDCSHGDSEISHFRGSELRQMLTGELPRDLPAILPADLCEFVQDKLDRRDAGEGIRFFNADPARL